MRRDRIDFFISDWDEILWTDENKTTFNIATTFGSYPFILMNAIPETWYLLVERDIEDIIIHESMHITLSRLEMEDQLLRGISKKLDNLFPNISLFREFMNGEAKFIK